MLTFCCSADGFASSRGDGPLATHADDSSVAAPCAPPAYDPPQSVTHPTLSGSSRTAKNLGRDAGYMGNALAFLTGRPRAYGYRHTERFLAELAQVEADDTLTEVLARWTSDLWKARLRVVGSPVPVFYIDGHRKAVYADHLIPRGLVGRQGKVLGCRALVVLHDQEGHPLFVTTHRGDQHLTIGLPAIITRYELAADLQSLKRVVVDREGMAAEFLATLASEGRTVVTVLRTDQYSGLESFRVRSLARYSMLDVTLEKKSRGFSPHF